MRSKPIPLTGLWDRVKEGGQYLFYRRRAVARVGGQRLRDVKNNIMRRTGKENSPKKSGRQTKFYTQNAFLSMA